ncbi:MAG: hypothetical protein LBK53_07245 [Heliobacteriaceae bacterium]|jgi:hypothetical protein|nr:hypothetical protein [Heliobacteriaceae bacterium]
MNVNNAREILKILLMKENTSMSKLAEKLSTPDKKVYQQTLSAKLIKGNLKFDEMVDICNILGYKIAFKKIKHIN